MKLLKLHFNSQCQRRKFIYNASDNRIPEKDILPKICHKRKKYSFYDLTDPYPKYISWTWQVPWFRQGCGSHSSMFISQLVPLNPVLKYLVIKTHWLYIVLKVTICIQLKFLIICKEKRWYFIYDHLLPAMTLIVVE